MLRLVLPLLLLAPSAMAWPLVVCAEADNLPFSQQGGAGFENRITAILAEEMGAEVTTLWLEAADPGLRGRMMRDGACDLVPGIMDGHPGFLTSYAYYRSSYVFLQRADAPVRISSFDDEAWQGMRIGLPASGQDLSPPVLALARRGLIGADAEFAWGTRGARALAAKVAAGELDIAVVWGAAAGAEARRLGLSVVPVSPEIEMPFVPMVFPVAFGMRPGDTALRDRVNDALSRRWAEVQVVLAEHAVPLVDGLPPPPVPSGDVP